MNSAAASERIRTLADCVVKGLPAADVGTDHGYAAITLLRSGLVPKVILTDINEGPLLRAKRSLQACGMDASEDAELRLGPGLCPLAAGEAASVIIAGMGGELIRDILAEDPGKTASFSRFVLQPRTRSGALRRWLFDSGFAVTDERLAMENGRICEIIVAEPGKGPVPGQDGGAVPFEITFMMEKDPLFADHLERYIGRLRKIAGSLCRSASPEAAGELENVRERLRAAEDRRARL